MLKRSPCVQEYKKLANGNRTQPTRAHGWWQKLRGQAASSGRCPRGLLHRHRKDDYTPGDPHTPGASICLPPNPARRFGRVWASALLVSAPEFTVIYHILSREGEKETQMTLNNLPKEQGYTLTSQSNQIQISRETAPPPEARLYTSS